MKKAEIRKKVLKIISNLECVPIQHISDDRDVWFNYLTGEDYDGRAQSVYLPDLIKKEFGVSINEDEVDTVKDLIDHIDKKINEVPA